MYSTQGVATGVSFTDQNARFLAFDVLTAISAFAGAFLIIGAFTRAMWPLGAVVIVWLSASVVLGTVYPGLVQRFQVEPDQLNRETPFIANNINMTRIAFDVDVWQNSNYGGEAPLTADIVSKEVATFRTPACGTTGRCATRSTSSRRSASTTTSRTSTRTATRSTVPLAR